MFTDSHDSGIQLMKTLTDWNLDVFRSTGLSHSECEDYVLCENALHFGIVCDGCSSSKSTAFGASLLAHSAEELFSTIKTLETDQLIAICIKHADAVRQLLSTKLQEPCLDATLLLGQIIDNVFQIDIAGDGVIGFRRSDNSTEVHRFNFSYNAPYYASYQLSDTRYQSYINSRPQLMCHETFIDGMKVAEVQTVPEYARLEVELTDIQHIILSTDGIESFYDFNNKTQDFTTIMANLLDFKTTSGAFLKRRVKRELKSLAQTGFQPADDLGLVAFTRAK